MKNIIFTIIVIAFSTNALAQEKAAQLGESQKAPEKTSAGGCTFSRTKKKVDSAKTASKTESKKAQTMDVKGN